MEDSIEIFELRKLNVGPRLGSGGFSSVFSAKRKEDKAVLEELCSDRTNSTDAPSSLDASSVASSGLFSSELKSERSSKKETQPEKLALKLLHSRTRACPRKTKVAVHDFQNEARILSHLPPHPNVIRLVGLSRDFWTAPMSSFLVLERLSEPLDVVIKQWRSEARRGLSLFSKKHLQRSSQAERICKAALGLANAMAFLHDHLIIFRDLKPANAGFDQQGNIKLFDFGMARQLQTHSCHLVGKYGTLRYMAPEVASKDIYTLSADVYCFGLLLWELCTLEKPFSKFKDNGKLRAVVVQKNVHPPLHRIASPLVRSVLEGCWRGDAKSRPSFRNILTQLEREVAQSSLCL